MSLLKSRFIEMFGDVINNKKTWPTKRWSDVLNIVNGKNQKKVECENGIYPICGSGGKIGKTNEYLTKENSVIIGRKGNINNPILMKTKFWNVDTAFGLEPNNKEINVEYLYKFCELFDFQRLNKTVTIPSLTKSDLLKIEIPVPPMKLQEEYRNFLAQVDKSKFLLQQILEKFELLKKSRFIELIGNIQNPKYPLVELNEICEFIKDGTHQTPIYTEDRVNGFKFLSSKDVTSQKINWTNIKYIPKELHEQLYAKLSPKRGDILLAKNGTTGVAAVVDSDEIFDIYVSLALLRPKSGVNVSYLCSALNSEDLKRQFNSSLKGIGVPNLHLREIKKARIIFPPIDIQNKISSITKQIDKSKFNVFQDQTAAQVKVIVVLHHIC